MRLLANGRIDISYSIVCMLNYFITYSNKQTQKTTQTAKVRLNWNHNLFKDFSKYLITTVAEA